MLLQAPRGPARLRRRALLRRPRGPPLLPTTPRCCCVWTPVPSSGMSRPCALTLLLPAFTACRSTTTTMGVVTTTSRTPTPLVPLVRILVQFGRSLDRSYTVVPTVGGTRSLGRQVIRKDFEYFFQVSLYCTQSGSLCYVPTYLTVLCGRWYYVCSPVSRSQPSREQQATNNPVLFSVFSFWCFHL